MKITQLYTYPIKSLRPTCIDKAVVTKNGFLYDRRFMLAKVLTDDADSDATKKYKNMVISAFPQMSLFHTDIKFPGDGEEGMITITFQPPSGVRKVIEIPLEPDTSSLAPFDIDLYGSTTEAHVMDARYAQWFFECFGFSVVLVYLGQNLRPVLFSSLSNAQPPQSSWLSSITSIIPSIGAAEPKKEEITFADCAPYLVVTQESCDDISARLLTAETMDITKYRPNIVLSGADEPWEEDYWAEIKVGSTDDYITLSLQKNCVRCVSINVDYSTGDFGTGESGKALKLMSKDRRVDASKGKSKYSPVFGRYGFLTPSGQGREIGVGDEVVVTKRNKERTAFDWPGL
ncbi:MOSC domain-containing protein [Tothia fuscella]|uniref:MOSC domain-containing protein n=1 Tax=Tothia fuscella TaxID=1048955 RepID=A0A9P4NLQ3_9PEZI|nr:MOSC domain-containing protein [Tothia fuscella]